MASAWPRTIATAAASSFRGGSDRRALSLISAGFSDAKVTSRSGLRAMARKAPATARLKPSFGTSLGFSPGLRLVVDMVQRPLAGGSSSTGRVMIPSKP